MQMSWLHQAFRECRSEPGAVPRLHPAVLVRGAAGEWDGNRFTGYGGKGQASPTAHADTVRACPKAPAAPASPPGASGTAGQGDRATTHCCATGAAPSNRPTTCWTCWTCRRTNDERRTARLAGAGFPRRRTYAVAGESKRRQLVHADEQSQRAGSGRGGRTDGERHVDGDLRCQQRSEPAPAGQPERRRNLPPGHHRFRPGPGGSRRAECQRSPRSDPGLRRRRQPAPERHVK